MNIHICMKSRLLADGLRTKILAENPEWTIAVNDDAFPILPHTDLFLTDGNACCRTIREREPDAHFILVDQGLEDQEVTFLLLTEHYDGIFAPDFDSKLLIRALRAVDSGQMWLEQKHLKGLVHNQKSRDHAQIASLTDKEQKITSLVSIGLRNKEIADRLCVCEQTVKSNLSKIYSKLNISNRAQLVRLVTTHSDNQSA